MFHDNILCEVLYDRVSKNVKYFTIYFRFQVSFQSAIPKFIVNIPNYVSKFGILGVEWTNLLPNEQNFDLNKSRQTTA